MSGNVLTLEERSLESMSVAIGFPLRSTSIAPWRAPSVKSALSVPAIFRAVSLISTTAGSLPMEVWRSGEMLPPEDRPKLAVVPNPIDVPYKFWHESIGWKAKYGESWWAVVKRDFDGRALALYAVPPYEVRVEPNRANRLKPDVYWGDKLMPDGDMILDRWEIDPANEYRGVGPLQLCGAAVSVAVEAQEWAANFYSEGGYPSVYLKSDFDFENEDEPTKIKQKWTSQAPNTPHILSPGLEPGTLPVNEQGAQMLNARVHNNGEVALMYGIPGSMLEYMTSGSSLTYQNVGQRFDDFVKACLRPQFLTPAEQALSKLLPRNMTAKFDTDIFTRADPKTRMEIHQIAIEAGVYTTEYAQMQEGIVPGDTETAPIEPADPATLPAPIQMRSRREVRCDGLRRRNGAIGLVPCNKLLAEDGPFVGTCPRCRKVHLAA